MWAGQVGTRGERRGLWEGSGRECEVGLEAEEACGRGKAASGRGFRDVGAGAGGRTLSTRPSGFSSVARAMVFTCSV